MTTRAIRLHVDGLPAEGEVFALPEGAARHAQVRRMQPGDAVQLFDGRGREHGAQVMAMGRREVTVRVGSAVASLPEWPLAVTLALGVPANERMDTLVEKATELGAAAIQPLWTERAVLRLDGERAERRRAHWQAIAVAACEQSGRSVVPEVAPPRSLSAWLAGAGNGSAAASAVERASASSPVPAVTRWMLDFADDAQPPTQASLTLGATGRLLVLSGPEGGLSSAERAAARKSGFAPVSLGPRVLRADTAPLALLAWLGLRG